MDSIKLLLSEANRVLDFAETLTTQQLYRGVCEAAGAALDQASQELRTLLRDEALAGAPAEVAVTVVAATNAASVPGIPEAAEAAETVPDDQKSETGWTGSVISHGVARYHEFRRRIRNRVAAKYVTNSEAERRAILGNLYKSVKKLGDMDEMIAEATAILERIPTPEVASRAVTIPLSPIETA